MAHDTLSFYDDLAGDYHLIFADWEASVRKQSGVLATLLADDPGRVLDVSCGIGTQSLALALAGRSVVGRDLSPKSVQRAAEEAQRLGVTASFEVGDARVACPADEGAFGAVISLDNALPHLLTQADVLQALTAARRALQPGGVLCLSTRDYDRLGEERPTSDPVRVFGAPPHRRLVLQVWTWEVDRPLYHLEHLLLHEADPSWTVRSRRATYRAWRREELRDLTVQAGFSAVTWRTPEETGFFQQLLTARSA